MSVTTIDLLSTGEMVRLSGVTFRRVDRWREAGVLEPEVPARGSGSRVFYPAAELRVLRVVAQLAATGLEAWPMLAEVAALVRSEPGFFWLRIPAGGHPTVEGAPAADGALWSGVPASPR